MDANDAELARKLGFHRELILKKAAHRCHDLLMPHFFAAAATVATVVVITIQTRFADQRPRRFTAGLQDAYAMPLAYLTFAPSMVVARSYVRKGFRITRWPA